MEWTGAQKTSRDPWNIRPGEIRSAHPSSRMGLEDRSRPEGGEGKAEDNQFQIPREPHRHNSLSTGRRSYSVPNLARKFPGRTSVVSGEGNAGAGNLEGVLGPAH